MAKPGHEAVRSRAKADGTQLGAYSRFGRLDRLAAEMPPAYEWAKRNGVLNELQEAFLAADGKWAHWQKYSQAGAEDEAGGTSTWKSPAQAARAAAWQRGEPGPRRLAEEPDHEARIAGLGKLPPVKKRRMEPRFQVHKVSESPSVVVVEVGDASALAAPHVSRLTQTLSSSEAEQTDGVVLDLAPIEHLDVSVIGLIIDKAEKMESSGGELVIVQPQPRCLQALEAIGVPARVRCLPTQQMAVDAIVEKLQGT